MLQALIVTKVAMFIFRISPNGSSASQAARSPDGFQTKGGTDDDYLRERFALGSDNGEVKITESVTSDFAKG
jgi:hypothetical protein